MDLDHERRLTEVEERSKSNSHRLDEVEKRQDNLDKLVSTVSVLASEQKHIDSDIKEIKVDVKTILDKPGKRWESIVEKIIWAVCAAVIAFLLGRVGL